MSDLTTMIVVLGGTFFVAGLLFYFSLRESPPPRSRLTRDAAIEKTAIIAATRDPDAGSSSGG